MTIFPDTPIDAVYHYHHPTTGAPAHCGLRIYAGPAGRVVVLTELGSNPGISVTNAAAEIATGLAAMYRLDPVTTTWIEHYNGDSYKGRNRIDDTFDEVKFLWRGGVATDPNWRRLTLPELRELLPELPTTVYHEDEQGNPYPVPAELRDLVTEPQRGRRRRYGLCIACGQAPAWIDARGVVACDDCGAQWLDPMREWPGLPAETDEDQP